MMRFANNFHEWWSYEWKSFANCITSDPKSLFMANNVLFYFFTCYLMSWTHNNSTKKPNSQPLILPLSPRTVFFDLALWRHRSWSVTSGESVVLALWRHFRWLFLHAYIGAKAALTSEYQPWISITNRPWEGTTSIRIFLWKTVLI